MTVRRGRIVRQAPEGRIFHASESGAAGPHSLSTTQSAAAVFRYSDHYPVAQSLDNPRVKIENPGFPGLIWRSDWFDSPRAVWGYRRWLEIFLRSRREARVYPQWRLRQ